MAKNALGLDAKDFKHIKSDAHSTTLQHKRGHLLTISHNTLSPKNQEALKALSNATKPAQPPPETDENNFDEGGKVPAPSQDTTQQDQQQRASQMSQGAQQSGGFPSLSTMADRIKNAYQSGGSIDDTGGHVPVPDGASKSPIAPAKDLAPATQRPVETSSWEDIKSNWWDPQKKAEGGPVYKRPELAKKGMEMLEAKHNVSPEEQKKRADKFKTQDQFMKNTAGEHKIVKMAEGGHPSHEELEKDSSGANDAYDAALPCLNPHCKSHGRPHPNCRCYSGGGASTGHEGNGYAKGGEVIKLRFCAHGMPHEADCSYSKGGVSEQGEDVRAANRLREPGRGRDEESAKVYDKVAKDEAKGRAQFEREHVKPKLKGLAEGGDPKDGESVLDTERRLRSKDSPDAADHYREASRLAEKAGDAVSDTPASDPNFNSVTGQTSQQNQPDNMQNNASPSVGDQNPNVGQQDNAQASTQQAQVPAGAPPQANPGVQQNGTNVQPNSTTIPQSQMAGQPLPIATQAILKEDQDWQQDLNNGHITPNTYNDLMYHNKDGSEKSTLGKIGSIFGLMLSGAGSGLAHQPNMALGMMDNAIKNDLEAQKTSKANADNYLRLNQNRLLNNANIKQILSSSALTDAQKAEVRQKIDMNAYGMSYMQMGRTALQSQFDNLKKMQPGTPQYQQAAQTLMLMADAVNKNNGATAAALSAGGPSSLGMYGMNAPGQQQMNPEQKFQNDMQTLEMTGQKDKADSLRARHIPGIPGFATQDVPPDKRDRLTAMSVLDDKVKDVLGFAKQHAGSVDPRVLQQARQKAEELTSFYNKSIDSLGMTQGRLGWLEEQIKKNPTSLIQQVLGNNARLGEIRDSNAHRRDIELNKLGFPVQPGGPGSSGASAPQTKTVNGVQYTRGPNGEAIRAK